MTKNALGLGIDTTFDDTSVAILCGHQEILANLTLSQYRDHAEFGGVVPERAARKHLEVIHALIDESCRKAEVKLEDLDYIAVSKFNINMSFAVIKTGGKQYKISAGETVSYTL